MVTPPKSPTLDPAADARLVERCLDGDARAWEALVRRHLPADTTPHGPGWAYTIRNEYGDTFDLWLCYDHYMREYRVRLLAPEVELVGNGHKTHLYEDG